MTESSILHNSDGQMILSSKFYNDFEIHFIYCDPTPEDLDTVEEPAMCLRASRGPKRGAAWIIMLEAASKYVSTDEGELKYSEYAMKSSYEAAEMIGLGRQKMTAFRICEAIFDNLEFLINMPPCQPEAEVVGHATGKIGDFEIDTEIVH